jgi:uncharacterized protein
MAKDVRRAGVTVVQSAGGWRRSSRWWRVLAGLLIMATVASGLPQPAPVAASASGIVISEFRFRGPSGANDEFVELFNASSNAVDIGGWKLQGCSSTAPGNPSDRATIPVSTTLAPGQHYLLVNNGTNGYSGSVAGNLTYSTGISDTAGAPSGARIVDGSGNVVDGVGTSSSPCREGNTGLVFPTTNADASFARASNGCQDTDNNASDFAATSSPGPQNLASTATPCPPGEDNTPPTVASTSPANGATNVLPGANVAITFDEPVTLTGEPFTLSCDSAARTFVRTGGPTTFTLNPDADLPNNATCTVTVTATGVADQDGTPDQLAENYSFSFSVAPPGPGPLRIRDIQGAGHISPLVTGGNTSVVNVPGIVTARRSNGFYIQDPQPDTSDATSEGIFVFTSSTPPASATVGNSVLVSGTVGEFRQSTSTNPNPRLTVTQISSPTINVVATGQALPAAAVIGTDPGERAQPTTVIEDDANGDVEAGGAFDPANDGLDFYESLEGMLVQVNNAVATGPTVDFGSNRELPVLADGGANAGLRTPRGGIIIQPGDFNPEIIYLNDQLTDAANSRIATLPAVNTGDGLGTITGVIDYAFDNFLLQVTAQPARADNGLVPEITAVARSGVNDLTVATFNVENLDTNDPDEKFDALAGVIVTNLRAPDIIALEEVQDNNGASGGTGNTLVDANETLAELIAAIVEAGGPTYDYRQINPVANQDGGEPGGNIRVAFLFRTDRPTLSFVDRPGGCSVCAVGIAGTGAGTQLTTSPGRIAPTNAAFNNSRKPLAGEFRYNGRPLFIIANHFNSKGGDQPLYGRFQPPTRGTEVQRRQQAEVVHDFVAGILTADANANVIVLGDLNDFQFSEVLEVLEGTGPQILYNLIETLPANEQYTYVFDGNSQALDHILVSANLFAQFGGEGPGQYDVVHVNAEFSDQVSDHDPQVARLALAPPPPTAGDLSVATPEDVSVTITLPGTAANGGPLTYTIVSGPASGTLGTVGGNGVTYTPRVNFNGPDSFTYRVTEDGLDSEVATVRITVGATNDPPVAANGNVATPEDTGIEITLTATDAEGSTLTYAIVSGPTNGTLGAINGNKVVYTPASQFSGTDSFTFRAIDGAADSNVATVSIVVNAVNDPPAANNAAVTTPADTAVNITLSGSDAEGAALTYAIASGPAHGTLGSLNGDRVTYTPNAGYSGFDSFTFRASDGSTTSDIAIITITVNEPSPPSYTLTVTTTGSGTITPGGGSYTAGQTATLTATPSGNAVFVGWTVDGVFAGYANPLSVGMNADHTVNAAFAQRVTFSDVNAGTPFSDAILQLAADGIIRGFGDGTFGPGQRIKRAESAALIARAMGWDAEDRGNPFLDRCDPADPTNCVDDALWRDVGTLAFYDVARGYPNRLYYPRDEVTHIQVISFITRAMVAKGYWVQETADNPAIYPNVTEESGHRLDLVTFVKYAGAVPDRPAGQRWADWTAPALRSWYAGVLRQALSSRFATTP